MAVDLFFTLSGFVITYAYQHRLDNGLPTWTFLKLRLIRLYPLYVLTLCAGLAVSYGLNPHNSWFRWIYFGLNAFFLPAFPWHKSQPGLYPFNGPSWTLLLELAANVFHAAFLRRRSTAALLAMYAVCGLLLWAAAIHKGTLDAGWDRDVVLIGLPRVLFPYLSGALLFRIWRRKQAKKRSNSILSVSLLAALAAVLMVPEVGRLNILYALLADTCLLPLIVYCGAVAEPQSRSRRYFVLLGTASYAVYLLQFSFVFGQHAIWKRVYHMLPNTDPPRAGLALIISLVAAALLLDTFYDFPRDVF